MRIILRWFRITSINTNVSVSNNLIVRTLETLIFATERCYYGVMRPKSLRLRHHPSCSTALLPAVALFSGTAKCLDGHTSHYVSITRHLPYRKTRLRSAKKPHCNWGGDDTGSDFHLISPKLHLSIATR